MRIRCVLAVSAALSVSMAGTPALSEVLPRSERPAGAVVAVKIGEEISFVETGGWQSVEPAQDLLAGDVLRTNELGQLAVLFADRTQIRLGRNTTLLVKDVGGDTARFGLEKGAIWARAARGGTGVRVDTPAATAAVRGTDWTLTVAPDGRTSMIVLEGEVELANAQGSVLVRQGEGASVGIGERPSKFVIVDVDDREQMLYYLTVRDAFTFLVPSPLPSGKIVAEYRRIAAVAADRRTPAERVAFAELALSVAGPEAARAAVKAARGPDLDSAANGRLTLVEALVAGFDRDYARAASLFAEAKPALSGSQRTIAAYGRYFARSLADPSNAEPPPPTADGGAYGVLAEAYVAGFLRSPAEAARIVAEGERRFPDEALLPAVRAQLAMLAGDVAQVEEAVTRAVGIDPDNPVVLLARALYLHDQKSELEAARADLLRAAELQPGSVEIWNSLGLVESDRDAVLESEAAFHTAIAANPRDPVPLVNLAVLYLDGGQLNAAKHLIDRAIELDPSLSALYVARGRYHLQTGDSRAAIDDLLKATTLDPAYANALLLLAAAYYENGDDELAAQALENAGRLDLEDPVASQVTAIIAIENYDAGAALVAARDSLRKIRARGGSYTTIAANREAGSVLSSAFRFLGLDAWGRAYADVAFDVFDGGSYFDKALNGAADPFTFASTFSEFGPDPVPTDRAMSDLFQGLLLYSYGASGGPSLRPGIVPVPFFETTVTGGYLAGTESGPTAGLAVNGHTVSPMPFSFSAEVDFAEADAALTAVDRRIANAFVMMGSEPTLADRVVVIGAFSDGRSPVPGTDSLPFPFDKSQETFGYGAIGWSHTIGHRNVVNVAAVASAAGMESFFDRRDDLGLGLTSETDQSRRSVMAGVNHAVGFGPATVRYGLEGGWVGGEDTTVLTLHIPVPLPLGMATTEFDVVNVRGFANIMLEASDTLTFESTAVVSSIDGVGDDGLRVEPRAGAAWSFHNGHVLRAMASRDSWVPGLLTLAPTDVLGLQPLQAPFDATGRADTVALRWDAEWTPHFFTALEYQHQEVEDLSLDLPRVADVLAIDKGSIDRLSLTANAWFGGGLGGTAMVAWTPSETDAGPGAGGDMPFVPEFSARAGLTYVSPLRIRASAHATFVGERLGDLAGTVLDDFVLLDAGLTWESPDSHIEAGLAVYNILDSEFEVAPDTAGWGRTLVGTLSVRF